MVISFFVASSDTEKRLFKKLYTSLRLQNEEFIPVVLEDFSFNEDWYQEEMQPFFLGQQSVHDWLPFCYPPTTETSLSGELLNRLFQEDNSLYCSNVSFDLFAQKADILHRLLVHLITPARLIILQSNPSPLLSLVEYVVSLQEKKVLYFERWCSRNSHFLSSRKIMQGKEYPPSDSVVPNIETYFQEKYPSTADSLPFSDFVLFLTAQDTAMGYAYSDLPEYSTVGFGWGNDQCCFTKIYPLLKALYPDKVIIVRNHPYSRFKVDDSFLSENRFVGVYDGARYALTTLIDRAYQVISRPTTVIYKCLFLQKPVICLGNFDLTNLSHVAICRSEEDFVIQLSANKTLDYDNDLRKVSAFVQENVITGSYSFDDPRFVFSNAINEVITQESYLQAKAALFNYSQIAIREFKGNLVNQENTLLRRESSFWQSESIRFENENKKILCSKSFRFGYRFLHPFSKRMPGLF